MAAEGQTSFDCPVDRSPYLRFWSTARLIASWKGIFPRVETL